MILKSYNKSQGISIEVIVIAAIAIAVLVITFLILTNQSSTVSKNLNSCSLKGGKCANTLPINNNVKDVKSFQCNDEYPIKISINDPECGESKLCCLKLS